MALQSVYQQEIVLWFCNWMYRSGSQESTVIYAKLHACITSFITSRLDYCNSLYYGAMVQNVAARLLTGSHKFDHISPILTSLHWLPVKQRIEFKILVFVFKALHGLAPAYLSDLVRCHNPFRALRSGNLGVLFCSSIKVKDRWRDRGGKTVETMLLR